MVGGWREMDEMGDGRNGEEWKLVCYLQKAESVLRSVPRVQESLLVPAWTQVRGFPGDQWHPWHQCTSSTSGTSGTSSTIDTSGSSIISITSIHSGTSRAKCTNGSSDTSITIITSDTSITIITSGTSCRMITSTSTPPGHWSRWPGAPALGRS